MHTVSPAPAHRPSVTAFFTDGAQSFPLPAGETMGELAGRIEALAAHHAALPVAIRVYFEAGSAKPHSTAARH